MYENIVKPKVFIAVCGLIDSGKSTFIKTATELISGFKTPLDALCNEHEQGITIRQASVFCPYKGYDFVFLDCPGHKEFKEEILSGLSKASYVIKILDETRLIESRNYLNFIDNCLNILPFNRVKKEYDIVSKSSKNTINSYNIGVDNDHFKQVVLKSILDDIILRIECKIDRNVFVNPVKTAIRVIRSAFSLPKINNPTLMFSYGKDSITLMQLLRMSDCLNKVKPLYLYSKLDMDEIDSSLMDAIKNEFNIEITPFKGVPEDWNFNNHSIHEIMKAKSEAIKKVLKDNSSQVTFVGSRHFEGDGTRAKDKFFSPRDENGNADFYKTSFEEYGNEATCMTWVNYSNCRVSPLLDFTEADIWRFIKHFNLPVCRGYFSKDGKRYRSLGDKDTTAPISSTASTFDEIIKEIEQSKDTERICRVSQDNSEKYGMEKIRTNGFF